MRLQVSLFKVDFHDTDKKALSFTRPLSNIDLSNKYLVWFINISNQDIIFNHDVFIQAKQR